MLTHCRVLRSLKNVPIPNQDGDLLFKKGDIFVEVAEMPGYFYRQDQDFLQGSFLALGGEAGEDRIAQGFFEVQESLPASKTRYVKVVKIQHRIQQLKHHAEQLATNNRQPKTSSEPPKMIIT